MTHSPVEGAPDLRNRGNSGPILSGGLDDFDNGRMNMPCPDIAELEQFVTDELPPDSRAGLAQHLSGCTTCASRLSEIRENLSSVGSVRQALAGIEDRDGSTAVPTMIGPYRVIRRLGRGGMGVVYEARQPRTDRPVAVKVLHLPFLGEARYVHAFQREIQALGRLSHPGIAAIYEAGQAEDGLPFFAMELVEGLPLLAYAREHHPPFRERIALFQKICEAVAYAHQRGVIHRDLKPSNILVPSARPGDGEHAFPTGTPKILDFGLARLLEPDAATGVDSLTTAPGRIFGTIPYMSPEQVRGDFQALDVRTDVYALGVILFELLTDQLPYELDPHHLPQAARIICERAPRRPSSLAAELRGDMDAIILKALEKDPNARYANASSLADDLRRFLAHEPIVARPPTLAYQLSRLIRRHKLPFTLAAAIVLLVFAFGGTAAILAARLATQRSAALAARDAAERRRAESEAVSTFLQDMLAAADPSVSAASADITLREVLDRAADKMSGGSLAEHSLVRVTLQTTIGNAYRAIAQYDAAESHLRAAVETGRSLTDDEGRAALSQSLNKLGRLKEERGRYEEAEALFREALSIRRELYGEEHKDVATSLNNLGLVLHQRGRTEEGERRLREALQMRRKLLGEENSEVATSMNNLAWLLHDRGRLAEAASLFEKSLALDRKLRGTDHPNIASTMSNLALIYADRGRLEEAHELVQQAIAMRRRLFGDDHPDVAVTLNNLAYVAKTRGDLEGAERIYRESLDLTIRTRGPRHPEVAVTLDNLSMIMLARGDLDPMRQLVAEAYDIRREALGDRHPQTIASLFFLGDVHMHRREYVEAHPFLEAAVQGARETEPPGHPHRGFFLARLGECLMELGRHNEAVEVFVEARPILIAESGENHPRTQAVTDAIRRLSAPQAGP